MQRQLLKFVAMFLVLGVAATSVLADGLPFDPPIKSPASPGDGQVATIERNGGDTIETAVVIDGLPFNDGGSTCGFVDDYDSLCGSSSVSPDVVYSFTATTDIRVAIDLCNSAYDTKVFYYEDAWSENAAGCDDDYYDGSGSCFAWTSRLIAYFYAGHTYYIVVDGYDGACGDFEIEVTEDIPCTDCPSDAMDEGEGPPPFGYIDTYNGTADLAHPLVLENCATVCGLGGNYFNAAGFYWYDTDYYTFTPVTNEVTISAMATGRLYVNLAGDGGSGGLFDADECQENAVSYEVEPGTTYWAAVYFAWDIFFEDGVWSPAAYVITFCDSGVVATESTSWSNVKALFD